MSNCFPLASSVYGDFPWQKALRLWMGRSILHPLLLQFVKSQDQLVLGWLPLSIFPTFSLTTSAEVWSALECIFSSGSRGLTLYLRQWIQSIKKGALSMDEYIGNISIHHVTLGELGPAYKSFVMALTTCLSNPITFMGLQNLLADQKLRMEQTSLAWLWGSTMLLQEVRKRRKTLSQVLCYVRYVGEKVMEHWITIIELISRSYLWHTIRFSHQPDPLPQLTWLSQMIETPCGILIPGQLTT